MDIYNLPCVLLLSMALPFCSGKVNVSTVGENPDASKVVWLEAGRTPITLLCQFDVSDVCPDDEITEIRWDAHLLNTAHYSIASWSKGEGDNFTKLPQENVVPFKSPGFFSPPIESINSEIHKNSGNSTIVLVNANTYHSGTYSCSVQCNETNLTADERWSNLTGSVVLEFYRVEEPYRFVAMPSPHSQSEVFLECKAKGIYPRPWMELSLFDEVSRSRIQLKNFSRELEFVYTYRISLNTTVPLSELQAGRTVFVCDVGVGAIRKTRSLEFSEVAARRQGGNKAASLNFNILMNVLALFIVGAHAFHLM